MVDHNPVYLAEREDGEFLDSECRLDEESIRHLHDLVLLPWNQIPPEDPAEQGILDLTHIGNGHIGRKVRDLRRIALLQLLKLLGGPGDKDDFVRCRQEGLGDRKADTAARAGDNDHLRFHRLTGEAGPSSRGGVLAGSWCNGCRTVPVSELSNPRNFRYPSMWGAGKKLLLIQGRAYLFLHTGPCPDAASPSNPFERMCMGWRGTRGSLRGIILYIHRSHYSFSFSSRLFIVSVVSSSSLFSNVVPSFSIQA